MREDTLGATTLAPAQETGDNEPMVRVASLLAVPLALAALAPTARADIFKLFAEVDGGGMDGKGITGDQKDSAFFKNPHGAYGALVGAELVFIDAWIQHHQFYGHNDVVDGGHLATWTQFGLGVHFQLNLGDDKAQKAGTGGFVEIGAGAWFGIGTGQQVQLPLDNAQLSDKGFLGEARLGFGTHLNKIFDLGISVPVSYGYFFKTGNGATANDLSTHYQGVQGEALLYFRANIRLL